MPRSNLSLAQVRLKPVHSAPKSNTKVAYAKSFYTQVRPTNVIFKMDLSQFILLLSVTLKLLMPNHSTPRSDLPMSYLRWT
jgi:hypothetical protein